MTIKTSHNILLVLLMTRTIERADVFDDISLSPTFVSCHNSSATTEWFIEGEKEGGVARHTQLNIGRWIWRI